MTSFQGTLLAYVVLACVAAWLLMFVQLPLLARSRFRASISALRDECVDQMLTGVLPSHRRVEHFVTQCDRVVRLAPNLSIVSGLVAVSAFNYAGGPPVDAPPAMAGMTNEQMNLVRALEARRAEIYKQYLLQGSLSGWLIAATLWAATILLGAKPQPTRPNSTEITSDLDELADYAPPPFGWHRESVLAGASS